MTATTPTATRRPRRPDGRRRTAAPVRSPAPQHPADDRHAGRPGLLPAAAVLAGRRLDQEHPGPVQQLRAVVLRRPATADEHPGRPSPRTTASSCDWLLNTLMYAVVSAVGAALLAAAAGYGFAKFRFRGDRAVFNLVLGAIMVPTTALAIPTYLLFAKVGLVNTPWAIILPSLVNPFGLYLMRVYAEDAVPGQPPRGRPHRRRRRGADLLPDRAAAAGARPGDGPAVHAGRDLEQLLPAADHAQRPEPVPGHGRAWPPGPPRPQNGGAGASSDMLAAGHDRLPALDHPARRRLPAAAAVLAERPGRRRRQADGRSLDPTFLEVPPWRFCPPASCSAPRTTTSTSPTSGSRPTST